jgi:hypothetical protein
VPRNCRAWLAEIQIVTSDTTALSSRYPGGRFDRYDPAYRIAWCRPGLNLLGPAELVGLIEAGRLVEFLAEAHPFGRVEAPQAPAMRSVPLHQVPLLRPGARPWW